MSANVPHDVSLTRERYADVVLDDIKICRGAEARDTLE